MRGWVCQLCNVKTIRFFMAIIFWIFSTTADAPYPLNYFSFQPCRRLV